MASSRDPPVSLRRLAWQTQATVSGFYIGTWDKLGSLQCEITVAPLRPMLFQLIFIKVTVTIDMDGRCYTLKFVFLSIYMVFSSIYLDL